MAGCLLVSACARPPASPQPERLAILRFENLGQDVASDWIGGALPEVVASELSGVPGLYAIPQGRMQAMARTLGARPISAPGISAEEDAALGAGANRLAYGEYWVMNGRLEVRLTIRDPRSQRSTSVLSASAAAGDVLGVATALARRISPRAGPYSTAGVEALKDYVLALESPTGAEREAYAGLALSADPNYGPAYRLAAELAAVRDRDRALAWLRQGLARSGAMPALERARLEVESAGLLHDTAAQELALANLAKLNQSDPVVWRELAQTALGRHDYRQAVDAFQRSIRIEPEDVAALNQLGYAEAYAGDLAAAVRALRRYQQLRPADVNPVDSLGDVHLLRGRLREAEDFYVQAARKDPHFLGGGDWFKAAMARLMTGDVAGADGLARQFREARAAAHDPALPLQDAAWQWISGRRQAAYTALQEFTRRAESGPSRPVASRAYSQLAIWSLMLGDREAARQMGLKASSLADAAAAPEAAIARFLALPPTAAKEWRARADQLAPNPAQRAIRDFALAHALLLDKQFGPAADVLREVYQNGASSPDDSLPVLLAWSYLALGRDQDAAPLLEFNPIPPPAGVGPLTAFYFPRISYLRGQLAQKQGKPDEAKVDYKLFVQLSGDREFQWGEEKKARQY